MIIATTVRYNTIAIRIRFHDILTTPHIGNFFYSFTCKDMSGQKRIIFGTNSLNYDRIFPEVMGNSEIKHVTMKPSFLMRMNNANRRVGLGIIDSWRAAEYSSSVREKLPRGYILALTNPINTRTIECAHDLKCKRIGITDISSYQFVKTLQKAYRIASEEFTLLELSSEYFTSLGSPGVSQQFDIIFTHVIPGTRYHMTLQNQNLAVLGFDARKLDMDRLKLFWPDLELEKSIYLPKLMGTRLTYPEKYVALPITQEYIVDWTTYRDKDHDSSRFGNLDRYGQRETFITRLDLPTNDDDNSSYMFRCYGDPNATSKTACVSPYDTIGNKRSTPTSWDAPCQVDADCPFYDEKRDRGRCLAAGFCELPVGVERTGFRRANIQPPYQPFCFGCDPSDVTCCTDPKKTTKPVWAFPGDLIGSRNDDPS